jgi:hypothetical protein
MKAPLAPVKTKIPGATRRFWNDPLNGMETSQAPRWKQQNPLFLWANSVEHINTFLATEVPYFL